MLNPDVPADQVADAYREWRESRGGNSDRIVAMMADGIEMRSVPGAGESTRCFVALR